MTVGARLPDFDLETSAGSRVTNNDLRGGRTVLYFYPKDDTPGCTLEGQEFTRLASAFAHAGVSVYGISPDTLKKHQRFIDKCGLGIPLISDPIRRSSTRRASGSRRNSWGVRTWVWLAPRC